VLVVDDDVRVQTDLVAMLAPANYDVRAVQGSGDTLIRNAKRSAELFRPHIAIVDLNLWDYLAPDLSGLDVIGALESAHCILYSAYLNVQVMRQARADRVTWVSKAENPQQLLDAVEDAARTVCALPGMPNISAPADWSPLEIVQILFPNQDSPPAGLVHDLIKQLFPESHTVTLEPLEDDTVVAGAVGRGRSVLIKAWRDDKRSPVVLKLGPTERIRQEAGNYRRYIDENLRGRFYAGMVEQPCYFWDLGGVLYAFMDTRLNDLSSFAAFYRQHEDPKALLRPLEHLISDVWGDFYRDSGGPTEPLYDAYDRVLRLNERLTSPAAQNLNWPPKTSLPRELPNPVTWVQQHKQDATIPPTRLAVTHGDLHADNLFVDADHAWVIDYERSGPGPILRDVTELEVDILTRLVAPERVGQGDFYSLAATLAHPTAPETSLLPLIGPSADREITKALQTVQSLRALAHRSIQIPDMREYYWGLLLDALFVALLRTTPSFQQERALILSAVLCRRLEYWEG